MLKKASWVEKVKWNADGLAPVIAQQYSTGDVLMLAWMNREALFETKKTGYAVYWSRSRQELWCKGATSGHKQKIRQIFLDCDNDAILILVDQEDGIACHTGSHSCFFKKLVLDAGVSSPAGHIWEKDVDNPGFPNFSNQKVEDVSILMHLYDVIERRKGVPSHESYVSSLMAKGENAILKKIGEESCEVVMAAKDFFKSSAQTNEGFHLSMRSALIGEFADLWFHCLIALSLYGVSPDDVFKELQRREGLSGLKEKASRKTNV